MVGVLGVAGWGVDQPDGAGLVVDEVAAPAAAGDLILPLFQVLAVVPVRGQVAARLR